MAVVTCAMQTSRVRAVSTMPRNLRHSAVVVVEMSGSVAVPGGAVVLSHASCRVN